MDIKSVNKIKVSKEMVEQIAEKYIESKVETEIPKYYQQLVDKIDYYREKTPHLYCKKKDIYYDFSNGCIFPNFYSYEHNDTNKFAGYQGREMNETEIEKFRIHFPKLDSPKLYVNASVEQSGDGTTWEKAVKTIGEAVNLAKEGDEIIVAEGEYQETVNLKTGIQLHGGYKVGEENLFFTPIGETKISYINMNSIQNVSISYVVTKLYINNCQNFGCYSIIVRDNDVKGRSNDPQSIRIFNSKGNFKRCKIENNRSWYNESYNSIYGGAIYIYSSNINFTHCVFKKNIAQNFYTNTHECGGAIHSDSSTVYVVQCKFLENNAYRGRDIYICSGSVYVVGDNIDTYNSPSYIQYDNLPNDIKKACSTTTYPIFSLVKEHKDNSQVFNALVANGFLELSEVQGQNTFLKDNFSLKEGFIINNIKKELYKNTYELNLDGEILTKKAIYDKFSTGQCKINREYLADIFLNADKKRVDLTPYDKKILEDITRGHWDLWGNNYGGELEIELEEEMVARNPKLDINYNGIVAIDFGTKSTVVAYQKEDDTTYIKRIGAGNLEEEVNNKDYENPTVLELRNLEQFLSDYRKLSGRPNTSWEDLTSSYTAANRLFDGASDEFYTVFSDLKQWAGMNRRKKIKDKTGQTWDLPLFSDLDLEKDINPIELYAYHIGLVINNMHGDGIFIDYILSFPVKYEDDLCQKICDSFERGLKKSLPVSILEDEEVMSKFKVRIGANEPAAYAVCALQEYGFEPEGEEEVVYGVFDFGGGTTDFDFGVWREPQRGSYDFEIEHFYDNGDKYLGGENILQLLAFEIFKDEKNQDTLKKNGITFVLPPECIAYPGSETLIVHSQEAEMNMRKLMEECRYFWEHNGESFVDPSKEESVEKFVSDTLCVALYDKAGDIKSCELYVDVEGLRNLIISRVNKGIRNFFESWKMAIKDVKNFNKFYIFLAGNSSKSNFVEEGFRNYIETMSEEIEDRQIKDIFEIFPPLGTEKAKVIQEERGGSIYEEIIEPTGKTGVAYGLIRSRESGKIKVIKKKSNQFKYFIGIEKRRKFKLIISRDIERNVWKEFIVADRNEFEIFYTDLPEVVSGDLTVKNIKKIHCEIDSDLVDENKNIYIRAVSNTEIEYTVASEEEIGKEDEGRKVYRKELV